MLGSSSKAAVLLVDDEAPIHYALGIFLRGAGYFVGYAENGKTGLKMFQESTWDLVITDRAMPEMDGEQLTIAVKKISPETPVVLITGRIKDDTQVELFDSVLLKPFTKEEFLGTVSRMLEKIPQH